MKNIVSTDDSVKRQITDSDLESRLVKITPRWRGFNFRILHMHNNFRMDCTWKILIHMISKEFLTFCQMKSKTNFQIQNLPFVFENRKFVRLFIGVWPFFWNLGGRVGLAHYRHSALAIYRPRNNAKRHCGSVAIKPLNVETFWRMTKNRCMSIIPKKSLQPPEMIQTFWNQLLRVTKHGAFSTTQKPSVKVRNGSRKIH